MAKKQKNLNSTAKYGKLWKNDEKRSHNGRLSITSCYFQCFKGHLSDWSSCNQSPEAAIKIGEAIAPVGAPRKAPDVENMIPEAHPVPLKLKQISIEN